MMRKLAFILFSPYSIALIITLVIIYFVSPKYKKYKTGLVSWEYVDKDDGSVYYHDLDCDGFSERVTSFTNIISNHAIKLNNNEGGIIDQWNFSDSMASQSYNVIIGDYNNNCMKEIYIFTKSDDSVFLNGFEPCMQGGLKLQRKFIDKIERSGHGLDFIIEEGLLEDLDKDGFKEVIFGIYAGFSKQPRKLYAYNIISDRLISSPASGNIIERINAFDLNDDGFPELTGSCRAPGNITDSLNIPYLDYSSWIFVYNNELEYLFDPVEFKGIASRLEVQPYVHDNNKYLVVLYRDRGNEKKQSAVYLYDINGRKLIERVFPINEGQRVLNMFTYDTENRNTIYLYDNNGTIEILNHELVTVESLKLKGIRGDHMYFYDLDNDGENEIVYHQIQHNNFTIIKNDFKHPVQIEVANENSTFNTISLKRNGDQDPELVIQINNKIFFVKYFHNDLCYLRYPLYLGIYIVILFIVWLIQRMQDIRIRQKQQMEKKIVELQLKSIRNELDPHFMFNAINSIGSMIYNEDKDNAYKMTIRFSNLFRQLLMNADKISRPLKEEIDFVRDYLELQKLRFRKAFDYKIEIEEKVNLETEVPKMVLHSYVENAIKYGISYKGNNGLIKIIVALENNLLYLRVIDNGPGFTDLKNTSNKSSGKGLKIMEYIYDLYMKLFNIIISHEIKNYYVDGKVAGTAVEIKIPINKISD